MTTVTYLNMCRTADLVGIPDDLQLKVSLHDPTTRLNARIGIQPIYY